MLEQEVLLVVDCAAAAAARWPWMMPAQAAAAVMFLQFGAGASSRDGRYNAMHLEQSLRAAGLRSQNGARATCVSQGTARVWRDRECALSRVVGESGVWPDGEILPAGSAEYAKELASLGLKEAMRGVIPAEQRDREGSGSRHGTETKTETGTETEAEAEAEAEEATRARGSRVHAPVEGLAMSRVSLPLAAIESTPGRDAIARYIQAIRSASIAGALALRDRIPRFNATENLRPRSRAGELGTTGSHDEDEDEDEEREGIRLKRLAAEAASASAALELHPVLGGVALRGLRSRSSRGAVSKEGLRA